MENAKSFNPYLFVNGPYLSKVDDIFESLYSGTRLKKPVEARKCFDTILSNLLWCEEGMLYNIGVNLNNNYYTKVKMYSPEYFTRNFMIKQIHYLGDNGFLNLKNGFYDRVNRSNSRSARIKPTNQLLDLVDYGNELYTTFNVQDYKEELILKDEHGNLVPYTDTKFTLEKKQLVKQYNKLIKEQLITIPTNILINSTTPISTITKTGNDKYLELQGNFYRVYNHGDFSNGGRFYSNLIVQRLDSDSRQTILINNNKVVEYDYTGLHISMLYNLQMLECVDDPYDIDYDIGRKLIKTAMLIILNAKNYRSAVLACSREFRESGSNLTHKQIEIVLNKLSAKHKAIQKFFFDGVGLHLQNVDSSITEEIIQRFCDLGIPIIPIHDSYIVEEKHANLLQTVMGDAYKKHMNGFAPKVSKK